MYVITVYSAKGGVGKTTTSVNLAAALAHCNKKVCLLDGDWQGNTTRGLGLDPRAIEQYALPDLLIAYIEDKQSGKNAFDYSARYLEGEGFYLIPTSPLMNNEQFRRVISAPENRNVLKELLEETDFDYIIIDTPASLDGFLALALDASNSVIIPTEMEFFSYDGLENTFGVIATYQGSTNPNLDIVGVLLNKVAKSDRSMQISNMITGYAQDFGIHVFDAEIPRHPLLHDCTAEGVSIFNRSRKSKPQEAFEKLAAEVIGLSEKEA